MNNAPSPRPAPAPPRPAPVAPAPEDGDLIRRFQGRRCEIRLLDGSSVTAVLNVIAKFSVLLTLTDGTASIVMKNAVVSICEKAKP